MKIDMKEYENPWWHPKTLEKKKPILKIRQQLKEEIVAFFMEKEFSPVDTPILQRSPGLEPHLMAFTTQLEDQAGEKRATVHLHTSPEFAMKKILVGGMEKIFQLATVFRNREESSTHRSEFLLLEWYRTGVDYTKIMEDCEQLLRRVSVLSKDGKYHWAGKSCDPHKDWERITVKDAFFRYAEVNLNLESPNNPKVLGEEAKKIGISFKEDDRWEDIFFRIFLDRIEPKLGIGAPTILYEYPASMAALSRKKETDATVAERFEIYINGLELANAFSELTDVQEQRERFESDMDLKEKLYGFRYPIDEDFLKALEFGLPKCSGIALGFDRLLMLLTRAEHIKDVQWASLWSAL